MSIKNNISLKIFDMLVIQELLARALNFYQEMKQEKLAKDEYSRLIAEILENIKFWIVSIIIDAGFEILALEELNRRIENDFCVLMQELFQGKRKIDRKRFHGFLRKRIAFHIISTALAQGHVVSKLSFSEDLSKNQNGRQLYSYYKFDHDFFSFFELGNGRKKRRKKDALRTKTKMAKHFVYTGFKQACLFIV